MGWTIATSISVCGRYFLFGALVSSYLVGKSLSGGPDCLCACSVLQWGLGFSLGYPKMSAALNATGRPIAFSCSWPAYEGGLPPEVSHSVYPPAKAPIS